VSASATLLVAGVDEAGRGCLAGPVFAAAVILDPTRSIAGLADSKTLTAKQRERLAERICVQSRAYAIASASVAEIDEINILQASLRAMRRAVDALAVCPDEVWVDGNVCPALAQPCQAIVGGDALHDCISAASILAKTARDALMIEWDLTHPHYGFAAHKGYGTARHLNALSTYGAVLNVHRQSFAPVRTRLRLSIA
jgi:ribonuclease HII